MATVIDLMDTLQDFESSLGADPPELGAVQPELRIA
jgi:hypothetical protein